MVKNRIHETEKTENDEQPVAAESEAAIQQSSPFDTQARVPDVTIAKTRQLVFLAPDIPGVPPRPRRSALGLVDGVADRQSRRAERDDVDAQDRSQGRQRGQKDSDSSAQQDSSAKSESRGRNRRRGGANDQNGAQEKAPVTEPQKVKGSTRLEAKKQRRREGRDTGRRRNHITESEFLARRESVDRKMIVRTKQDRIQIGVLEDNVLVEHYVARSRENSLIGNVYLGKVQNVLPSMEAAFVDIGRGRNAVLYSGEVDWSEYSGSNASRKIEKVLSPGDEVLVQVTKDPVGHKGARLTSQISFPGRYLVYVPGGTMNGISRKLPDNERSRLKKALKKIVPESAGVIVRTAAEGASEEQLTRDVNHLTGVWQDVQEKASKGGAPATLHSEADMLIKIIRDVFNEDFQTLVVDNAETHTSIEKYLNRVAPDLLERVSVHEGSNDIFDEYRVTEQIQKALDRKVWLPSGGSLVIDRTEAMTVVDVNTGKFVGSGGNLEETVTKNNLEAAEEIVRQLRLRDIGGIIVIDFIDMVLESNRDLVQRRLIECLGRDRTKHQVAEVTSLGLVQMTRKKIGLGLLESFSESCETCAGRGVLVHHEPVLKHKNESQKGKRRSKGTANNNAQKNQNGNGGGAQNGTHQITEAAKSMLAQVAAKTIQTESSADAVSEAVADAPEVAKDLARDLSLAAELAQTKQHAASKEQAAKKSTEVTGAEGLLDAVLDALPPAKAAGATKEKKGRRRASRPAQSAGETPES